MIKNSDVLFKKLLEFQNQRKEIVDNYDNRRANLERAKGSQYYTDELRKAEDTKNAALDALKAECRPIFDQTLQSMSEANRARGMTPPTDDELRLLQLLKMKEHISETEFEAAANTLKGNPACLSVLTEIAHKQGIMRGYTSYAATKEMPVDAVANVIEGLTASIRDFMEHDTPKAARLYIEHHAERYGIDPNAAPPPKRPLFTDKGGCYRQIANLYDDALTAFCRAVDGGEST